MILPMRLIWTILFGLGHCFSVQAQKSWDVEAPDKSIKVTNYRAFDQGLDSVVIRHKDARLSFFGDSLCQGPDDESCKTGAAGVSFISDIQVLDDSRYMLFSFSNGSLRSRFDLMIYNKQTNAIDFWLISSLSDKTTPTVLFYYLEDTQELLLPKAINFIDAEWIHTVDYKNKTAEHLVPIKKDFKTVQLFDSHYSYIDRSEEDLFYVIPLRKREKK